MGGIFGGGVKLPPPPKPVRLFKPEDQKRSIERQRRKKRSEGGPSGPLGREQTRQTTGGGSV